MTRSTSIRIPGTTVHHLVKSDTWQGFEHGDTVIVTPDPMDRFGGRYDFLAFVTNMVTGAQWVDLWGGPPKHATFRSVRPDRIQKVDSRRKR